MTLKLRLSLVLLAAAAIAAVFLTQRPLPAPAQAAAYSGVAQIDGPLQLDLTLSPPVSAPGDTLELALRLRNRSAAPLTPTVTVQLPPGLRPRVVDLPRGVTLNVQTNALQWLPLLPAGGAQALTLPLRVETADLLHPERDVTAVLRYDDRVHEAAARLWIGLPPRIAQVTAQTRVAIGQPLQLQAEVDGPGPVQQTWFLGDGRRVQVNDPLVVYPAAGVYNLRLEAANPLARVAAVQQITVVPHPAAQFAPDDDTPAVGQVVTFRNASGGQAPLTYLWRFGDGGIATDPHPTHVYAAPGKYQVQLTLENEYGTSEAFAVVTVGHPPAAEMVLDEFAPAGMPLRGAAAGDAAVTEFQWEMGDGRTYSGDKVSHSYRRGGAYYVTMLASNEFGTTRVGRWVTVAGGPQATYLPVVARAPDAFAAGSSVDPVDDPLGLALEPVPLDAPFTLEPLETPLGASPAERLFLYVNAARARFDLAPLAYGYELSVAAQAHAADMAANDFTAHLGSDGSAPAERLLWYGYRRAYAGEATAWGYEDPRAAVEFWVNSDSHRPIILNPYATDVGVGFAQNYGARSLWYWTAEFGNSYGSPLQPTLRVQTPAAGHSALNSEVVTYSWIWPRPLGPGERFVVYLGGPGGMTPLATTSAPAYGFRFAVAAAAQSAVSAAGELNWRVQLENSSGAVLAAGELRPITLARDPSLPTATPLPTITVTPSPTPPPGPTPRATAVPPPTFTPLPTQPPPPPIVTATPLPTAVP
jgi:uncharacterized protein YkwD/chitodextrinase